MSLVAGILLACAALAGVAVVAVTLWWLRSSRILASKRHLETVFDHVDPMVVVDVSFRILRANRAFASLMSRSWASLLGHNIDEILGSFLPYLLLLMMFSGSMQPGIYVTAGEKERGTLQSLLSTRLPRNQIILGKLFYVFAMGILAAVLNLLSMGFTFTRMVGPAMAANNAAHGGAPSSRASRYAPRNASANASRNSRS